MPITSKIQKELFEKTGEEGLRVVWIGQERRARREDAEAATSSEAKILSVGIWSAAEHGRFLEALSMYPSGPWKRVAEFVGTRTTRQVMTHAQKYRRRIMRLTQQARQQAASRVAWLTNRGEFRTLPTPRQVVRGNITASMSTTTRKQRGNALTVVIPQAPVAAPGKGVATNAAQVSHRIEPCVNATDLTTQSDGQEPHNTTAAEGGGVSTRGLSPLSDIDISIFEFLTNAPVFETFEPAFFDDSEPLEWRITHSN